MYLFIPANLFHPTVDPSVTLYHVDCNRQGPRLTLGSHFQKQVGWGTWLDCNGYLRREPRSPTGGFFLQLCRSGRRCSLSRLQLHSHSALLYFPFLQNRRQSIRLIRCDSLHLLLKRQIATNFTGFAEGAMWVVLNSLRPVVLSRLLLLLLLLQVQSSIRMHLLQPPDDATWHLRIILAWESRLSRIDQNISRNKQCLGSCEHLNS